MKRNTFFLGLLIFLMVFGFGITGCDQVTGRGDTNIIDEDETDNGNDSENESTEDKTDDESDPENESTEDETDDENDPENESDEDEISTVGLTFTNAGRGAFHQGNGTIYSNIYDVAFGNGKFVAVGIAGQITHSTDGSTWTAAKNNGFRMEDTAVQGITYGGGKFVAFGSRRNVVSNGQITTWRDIVYSSDGINWTRSDSSSFDIAIADIIYGGDKFLALSSTGKIGYLSNGGTWLPVTDNALDDIVFSGIVYGAGKFVAIGSSSKIAYSADGITWTVSTVLGAFNRISYINGKFMAWGNGIIADSTDAITWIPLVNNSFSSSTVYGAGKFVSWNGSNISYSIDKGITWITVDSTFDESINTIVYGNDIFVAVGGNFGQIAFSNKQK